MLRYDQDREGAPILYGFGVPKPTLLVTCRCHMQAGCFRFIFAYHLFLEATFVDYI